MTLRQRNDSEGAIFDTSPSGIRRAINGAIVKALQIPPPRPVPRGPRVVTTYSDGRKLVECDGKFYELDEREIWRSYYGKSSS